MALAWVHKCLNWEVMEPERAWYTPTILLASSGSQQQMLMGVHAALRIVREAGRESDVWRCHFPACQWKASKLQEHLSVVREPPVVHSPPCQSDMFHCNLEIISMGSSDGESARQKGPNHPHRGSQRGREWPQLLHWKWQRSDQKLWIMWTRHILRASQTAGPAPFPWQIP